MKQRPAQRNRMLCDAMYSEHAAVVCCRKQCSKLEHKHSESTAAQCTHPRWQSPSEREWRCVQVTARGEPVFRAIWSLQHIGVKASLSCSSRGVGAHFQHQIPPVVDSDSLGSRDGLALCVSGCSEQSNSSIMTQQNKRILMSAT
jgi:hypothetical protein